MVSQRIALSAQRVTVTHRAVDMALKYPHAEVIGIDAKPQIPG